MKKHYYKLTFAIYGVSVLFCGACRIYMHLNLLDAQTGFYLRGAASLSVMNAVLAAALILLVILNALKSVDDDYPVFREARGISVLAALTGVSMLLYVAEYLGWITFANTGVALSGTPLAVCGVLGVVGAVCFILCGILGAIRPDRQENGLLPLAAGVWMIVLLVIKFNKYSTLTSIYDNLLAVLFMVFCAMFLVGHARTLASLARKDGRNYTISAGLCASLCGFLLVIPNYAWIIAGRAAAMPALLLGTMESVFVLFVSVYALVFSLKICSSIRQV